MQDIKRLADELFDEAVKIRRTIHSNPELGFCENNTADLICKYLDEYGIPYKRNVAKTGVVALLEVDKNFKTLLIRADMDALPMQEETDVEFKSKVDGAMHACGHDVHTTIVLATAMLLSKIKEKLNCNVKFMFQPAEEVEGGADPMIKEGVMENPKVDAVIGGHVMTNVPVGKILFKYDEMMAAPDSFDMTVYGKGGHGAEPHNCIDPIAIGMQILSAWNTLSARYTTPLEKHLISVNQFHAGTCFNIIPDTAYISGTVRTFNEEVRCKLAEKMRSVAEGIAKSFGGECKFDFTFRYPPLVNDEKMTDMFKETTAQIIGEDNVIIGKYPSMGGEDFAYLARLVPSCFVNFGAGNPDKGAVEPLHSSKFIVDEDCIKTGMLAFANFAVNYGK